MRSDPDALSPAPPTGPLSGPHRRFSSLLLPLILAAALLVILAGLSRSWLLGDDTLSRVRKGATLRIGYALEAPYAFLAPDGRVTGESPEIARAIAARLGIARIEWRLTEFAHLIEDLENGRFDVIAAGMFITPDRERRVAFSRPTFRAGPALLVRPDNPRGLRNYADLLRSPHSNIAVLMGSTEETHLLRAGCPPGNLVRVPDALSGQAAVRSGQADVLALSAPTLRWMTRHPIVEPLRMIEFSQAEPGAAMPIEALGGFGFRKNDRALRRAWNAELARYLGSAEHRRLVQTFGFTPAEQPPVSAATPGTSPP